MEVRKDKVHSLIKVFAFFAILISAEVFISVFKPAIFTIVSTSKWGISFNISNVLCEGGLAIFLFFVIWAFLPKLNGKKIYIAYVGAYIFAVISLVTFSILESNTLMTVIQIPITLFFATMAVYCAMRPSEEFFTFNIIAFCVSAFLVSYMFALIAGISLGDNFVLLLMIYLYIAIVVKNQNKMDDVFVNQAVEKLSVSKKMRVFNLVLITSVFLVIVVIYFGLKDYALMIAPSIIPGIISMIRATIKFINKVLPIQTTEGAEDFGNDEMVDSPLRPEIERNLADYSTMEKVLLVLVIILALIILYLIIRYGVKAIREVFKRMNRRISGTIVVEEEEDYTDTIEEIDKKGKKKERKIARRKTFDDRSAIRKLYSKLLKKWGNVIDISDTPDDIEKKIEEKTRNSDVKKITNKYQAARYGEKDISDIEIEEVKKIYDDLDK